MPFSKKDYQKVFKEVVTELGSFKYDEWSFITARHKKLGVTLGDYFLHNDLKKIIGRNPIFLRHIKFDVFGKAVSLKPMDTKNSIPKELLQIKSSVLNGVRKVKLRLPYWILFRSLHKIHLNKKGLSPQEQMKNVNEAYERYCTKRTAPKVNA